MLQIKEIFGPTIQGEGFFTGWPAIFVRFAGCNMWNGKLEDRAASQCPYCDTEFTGGEGMDVITIMKHIDDLVGDLDKQYLVVLTGGEPLLQQPGQLNDLCMLIKQRGHKIQVETNGTIDNRALKSIDWVVCSPKVPFEELNIPKDKVHCWKILYPHATVKLKPFIQYAKEVLPNTVLPHNRSFYIQPIMEYTEGVFEAKLEGTAQNYNEAINKVMTLGLPWKLSLQTHKIIGVE